MSAAEPTMTASVIRHVPAGAERDAYLPLFRLADDSEIQLRGYYQQGDLYTLDDALQKPLAIVLVVPRADGAVELKAVAVDPAHHAQGIGQRMVAAVLDDLRQHGTRRVIVGTSTSSIGPLAFYQKVGFRFWRVERDWFSPARGYPAGTLENGIPLRDRVWLDMDLEQA
jgi:GNAT superfamily N-acetyltransferase